MSKATWNKLQVRNKPTLNQLFVANTDRLDTFATRFYLSAKEGSAGILFDCSNIRQFC
ncbi:hypothetical protein [Novosphingobium sp.]|uniref:hypothetical protein n=1 Tax=Novosphingobium sp. TaxID=1874826 RepID=UPI0028AE258F|nr:hypothetical protein [Novosphingobium sp.]